MLADNITNLSQASIWRMNNLAPASQDTSNIQSSIVLQILKINDSTPEDESTNPILLLSDGVYYDKFLFYSNAKKEVRVLNLKENDIICCKIIPAKNKALVVIQFDLIYNDVAHQINDPQFIGELESEIDDSNMTSKILRLAKKISLAPHQSKSPIQQSDKINRESNGVDEGYTPISMMTVYSYDFTIKARLIKKSTMREYKQARGGQGNLFNVEFMDGSDKPKNVIKGTFFSEVATRFYSELEEGKIYVFTGGEIKPKNQRFNTTHHQVEILFGKNTSITEAPQGNANIAMETYNFELINMIEKYNKYHPMDVMVIVQKIGEPEEINLRAGGTQTKKNVEVYDESGACVNLTLWGEVRGAEHLQENSIIGIKNVSVNEFRGKCLSSTKETSILVDFPDTLERYASLLEFYKSGKQVHSVGQQGFEGKERKMR